MTGALLLLGFVVSGQPAPRYQAGAVARPDGASIAYYVREGPGANLVLIPGSWGDHRVFDAMAAALDPSLRLIAVELRGHGASRPAAANPSMTMFAEDVLAVADHLALDRFYVGGHSIGGMAAIEIAGRRPRAVAGAIAMEGWTHHQVQAEALPGAGGAPLTPDENRRNQANRDRVRGRLSEAEIAAFGAVWKQWDGLPILESTSVPVLELWGDRNHPRPSREKLRIPARAHIELQWIAGSSHSLLIQRPKETAAAVNAFVARCEQARVMLGEPPTAPPVAAEAVTIYRGVEGITGFNMHPYVTWFGGRFWAMWSSNRIRDLQAGQYVRYATSADGVHWSESAMLTPSEEKENFRYFARGFWIRDGELIALAARDEAERPLFGPGLELRGYRWRARDGRWDAPFAVAADTINNFPPRRLPSGEWMLARRDHRMRTSMLIGGVKSPSEWRTVTLPAPADGSRLDEPEWWTLPDGRLAAAWRDGDRSRRLYRSFSEDGGASWTPPVRTDFPDAMAKFNVLRLSTGVYAMASNPNPSGKRIPLSLSLSDDGIRFGRTAVLRGAGTIYRYSGKDPGYAGYHYPQLLEHGGALYVIHSENMEDIVLLRLPAVTSQGH
jgi:pimeloyl-ACP methyl ester carboxylesterase